MVKDPKTSEYLVVYLAGAKNSADWSEGELKGRIIPTGTTGFYKAVWYDPGKKENDDGYAFVDDANMLNIAATGFGLSGHKFVRLFPLNAAGGGMYLSSGTGFAVSSGGLVATNYHVIEGAAGITVTRWLLDSVAQYSARVVLEDRKNDLALLQIEGEGFSGFDPLPYAVRSEVGDNGESVFVLGYPLITTMGEDVKLTNGIISSKTGYQGNATTYQISAPVQPGNSGGPLFDADGNVIGVVTAKHTEAENASYAIKATYLRALLDQVPNTAAPDSGRLAGLPLARQVKELTGYVFLIKIN